MYGDTGYLYVMLYARFLAKQKQSVLVVDCSEDGRLLSHLPLPEKKIDCLFYQGVDYQISREQQTGHYDIILYYYGDGECENEQGAPAAKCIIFTDHSKSSLSWAVEKVWKEEALLVVTGVPERGAARRLLEKRSMRYPKECLRELPWKKADARVLMAQEHGIWASLHCLSRDTVHLMRELSDWMGKGDAYADRLLE